MVNARQLAPTLAPLAFSLSIRSEGVPQALYRNRVDSTHLKTYPVLLGLAAVVACASLFNYLLPGWLSIALALFPGVLAFKYGKLYFSGAFADERIQANRELLLKVVDSPDAHYFADVAESIVNSHYGKRPWAKKAQQLRGVGVDPYLYLATAFTYSTGVWYESVKRVYDLHLAGVAPSSEGRVS